MRLLKPLVPAAVLLHFSQGARPEVFYMGELKGVENDLEDDHAAASDLTHSRAKRHSLAQVSKENPKISSALAAGIVAINDAIGEFIEGEEEPANSQVKDDTDNAEASSPGYIREGLEKLSKGMWAMVDILIPAKYKASHPMEEMHDKWSQAFSDMPDISADIATFRRVGDTAPLMKALKAVIDKTVHSEPGPEVSTYLEALNHIVEGLGSCWDSQSNGQLELAIQAVWQGLSKAIAAVDRGAIVDSRHHITNMDTTVSQLVTRVLAYKRRTLASKVCYKRSRTPPKRRPSKCLSGWVLDKDNSFCKPHPTGDVDCSTYCHAPGMCSSYCGHGQACCKPDQTDPVACAGSAGFKDGVQHHQCVKPGDGVAFFVQDAGEAMLRGYWTKGPEVNGRKSYEHNTHADVSVQLAWSTREEEWQIFKTTGAGGDKVVLYKSRLDSQTFPTHDWVAVNAGSPPTIIKNLDGNFKFAEPSLQEPPSNMLPDCDPGYERQDLWCVAPCPDGFAKKVQKMCEQTCGEEIGFPTDGKAAGICGTTPDEMQFATMAMQGMGGNSHFSPEEVLKHFQEEDTDVDVNSLTATLDALIGQSEEFPHPPCKDLDQEE